MNGPIVFALDKDDGRVLVLSSPLEAATHCKPIDVKDGYWLFFADDGSPLEPWFEHGNEPDDSADHPGEYALERAMSGLWLQERLDQVASVEGCGLKTATELVETLKVNRSKRLGSR